MILLLACIDGPGRSELPEADSGVFQESAEPELGASCGNPSCHGSVNRPYEVYAVHFHRADPDATFLDDPLTDEEHRLNQDRARAFLHPTEPAASPLLRMPLDPAAGGLGHGGSVTVYLDRSDPGWLALAAWAGAE